MKGCGSARSRGRFYLNRTDASDTPSWRRPAGRVERGAHPGNRARHGMQVILCVTGYLERDRAVTSV